MSYDKRTNGGAAGAPPKSTLASLLSSQRRSAAQNDRYRVQQARPFADRAHIDKAVSGDKKDADSSANAAVDSRVSQQAAGGSSGGVGAGRENRSSSYQPSHTQSGEVSTTGDRVPESLTAATAAKSVAADDDAKTSATESKPVSDTESKPVSRGRVVRFSPPTETVIAKPVHEKKRRKRSRWDVKPAASAGKEGKKSRWDDKPDEKKVDTDANNDNSIPIQQTRQREGGEADSELPPQENLLQQKKTAKSILKKKVDRQGSADGDEGNAQTLTSNADDTAKRRKVQVAIGADNEGGERMSAAKSTTETENSATAYPRRCKKEGEANANIEPKDREKAAKSRTDEQMNNISGGNTLEHTSLHREEEKKVDGISTNEAVGNEVEPAVRHPGKAEIKQIIEKQSDNAFQQDLRQHESTTSGKKVEKASSSTRNGTAPTSHGTKRKRDGMSTKPKSIAQKSAVQSKQNDASTAASSASRAPQSKKKKKKEFSPFRVKVGCVVAVRFRKQGDGGNSDIVSVVRDGEAFRAREEEKPLAAKTSAVLKQVNAGDENCDATTAPDSKANEGEAPERKPETEETAKPTAKDKPTTTKRQPKHYEVWSSPIPGQDDGLSLLGSWIRCAFPKSFVSKWQKENNTNEETNAPPVGRILEGNVISIHGRSSSNQSGIAVSMLVDRSSIKTLPYLQVESDDTNDTTISSSEQKRRKLEAKIRGEDKVVAKVKLASIFDQRNGTKLSPGVVSQWAIRKRVSAKPCGKKPTKKERKQNKQSVHSLFIGDGNDVQSQQEQNWRWIASRTAFKTMDSETDALGGNNKQDAVSQLVGEVIKMDVSPEGSTTLAMVTMKQLCTPEQTKGGRLAHHGALELFDSSCDKINELHFQAPIEDLIVIGKGINRQIDDWSQPNVDITSSGGADSTGLNFTVTHSYRPGDNTYMPLCGDVSTSKESLGICHNCQRTYHDSQLQHCQNEGHESDKRLWCLRCSQLKAATTSSKTVDETLVKHSTIDTDIGEMFSGLEASLKSASPKDFTLTKDSAQLSLRPSFLPITGSTKSKSYSKEPKNDKEEKPEKKKHGKRKKKGTLEAEAKPKKEKRKLKAKLKRIDSKSSDEEDDHVFKPISHRAVPFDQLKKSSWGSSKLKLASSDAKEPLFRETCRPRPIMIGKKVETTTLTGRAARANQRRMFKSLAALGDASKNVDRLAGRDREQQLRFDKSQIHGWGVFAEEPISAGDMIIEYRGEIIGNAVADKREIEYEKAKLDDYMFRIDAYTVCDATMLGNVARYINASCSPNCYTKIVTAGENKRIVIYAKRDIHRGEELSYDYKFSLEYDPTKRIPCHCGSVECQGFMNWNKKYV